ncbi:hypothetical protein NUU61_000110 [Penicillium alfredii]|uniref:Uncharacterized protein n=1 Tax=Penicillium alfredii TaxID=1506179 RepID=A0A9W9G967_9EURO|nr:uncharacterized protein NUU61_000110 [Penicillium alfredii]KAJ5114351.1 hypothetical protein NUU61_000110 [Penicillium alfredii]
MFDPFNFCLKTSVGISEIRGLRNARVLGWGCGGIRGHRDAWPASPKTALTSSDRLHFQRPEYPWIESMTCLRIIRARRVQPHRLPRARSVATGPRPVQIASSPGFSASHRDVPRERSELGS